MPGTDMVLRNQDYARQLAAPPAPAKAAESGSGFSFGDFLDIINPLQHIPVVSTIYRHLTGDKISTPEKIAGDTLYGGLTGLICSLGDALFTEVTGKSVGDTVYAAVIGDDEEPATAVAQNGTAAERTGLTRTAELWSPAPAPATHQQAAAAYRASGRLLAAY
ncbi:hypothetical protein GCM10008942_41730 [Rhizomicrobium electricum]|uniref:Uncharacterized protein n=2 Tax=Rhizomicrobium electricum TaxID=480070 RepID=A0ABP3QED1_9PROT